MVCCFVAFLEILLLFKILRIKTKLNKTKFQFVQHLRHDSILTTIVILRTSIYFCFQDKIFCVSSFVGCSAEDLFLCVVLIPSFILEKNFGVQKDWQLILEMTVGTIFMTRELEVFANFLLCEGK